MNLPSMIEDLENGQISEVDHIKLFSYLIKTDKNKYITYNEIIQQLIKSGTLSCDGDIIINLEDYEQCN